MFICNKNLYKWIYVYMHTTFFWIFSLGLRKYVFTFNLFHVIFAWYYVYNTTWHLEIRKFRLRSRRRQWHPTLAWKIPWAEDPGGLQSMGSQRVQTWLSNFTFPSHFYALEKEMETHSSVLAWRIPGTEEPGGLPSMGSHSVVHDWSDLAAAAAGSEMLYF